MQSSLRLANQYQTISFLTKTQYDIMKCYPYIVDHVSLHIHDQNIMRIIHIFSQFG